MTCFLWLTWAESEGQRAREVQVSLLLSLNIAQVSSAGLHPLRHLQRGKRIHPHHQKQSAPNVQWALPAKHPTLPRTQGAFFNRYIQKIFCFETTPSPNNLVAIKVTQNRTTHKCQEVKDAAHSNSYKILSFLPCSRARISLPADYLGRRNGMNSFVMNALHREGVVLTVLVTKSYKPN